VAARALGTLVELCERAVRVAVPLHRVDVRLLDGWHVGQQVAHHLAQAVAGGPVAAGPLLLLEPLPGRWLAHRHAPFRLSTRASGTIVPHGPVRKRPKKVKTLKMSRLPH